MKNQSKREKAKCKSKGQKNLNNLSLEWRKRTKEAGEEINDRNVQTPFPEELCQLLLLLIFPLKKKKK